MTPVTHQAEPVAHTLQGRVRGREQHGVAVYRNIPYAAPPTGAARFAAPRPHPPWQDRVWDASTPGPTAPQAKRDLGGLDMSPYFGPGWVRGADYLTASVWAPLPPATGLPTMVFVHGGGFVAGSTAASLYDGTAFARDGVVLVTLNYRLGIPGFLDLPDAPPNRGMLDVAAALRWVQQNIASFGGDPGNVTLFGQSAGATIVSALVADDDARGLFRRAIVQSGSGLGAFTPEQAARVTRQAADALGIEPRAEAFAGVPDALLVETATKLAGIDLRTATHTDPLVGLTPFSVVLDRQPAHTVADGRAAAVDLLVGSTAEEANLYLVPNGAYTASTEDDARAVAARSHQDPHRVIAAYRAARPDASPGELRSAVLGDALFGAGTRALADAHAARPDAHTYAYCFAWRSQALDGRLGACHVMELPFVFDTADRPELHGPAALLGPGRPPAGLAAGVHSAWVRFASTGSPGWDRYRPGRRTTMLVDTPWTPVCDHRDHELCVWS